MLCRRQEGERGRESFRDYLQLFDPNNFPVFSCKCFHLRATFVEAFNCLRIFVGECWT